MKRKLPPQSKRRPTGRYLILLLCLSFLAGQVQYAYATYYCTIERKTVQMPSREESSSPKELSTKVCDACQGVIVVHHSEGVAKPDCLRIEKHKKDVTDSFVENGYAPSHSFVSVAIVARGHADGLNAVKNLQTLPRYISPPEDIPVLGSSLRI